MTQLHRHSRSRGFANESQRQPRENKSEMETILATHF
jgi:hypothetical protein